MRAPCAGACRTHVDAMTQWKGRLAAAEEAVKAVLQVTISSFSICIINFSNY